MGPVRDHAEAEGLARGFGGIAVRHLEAEVIDPLSVLVEEATLRGIQFGGLSDLDLHIFQITAFRALGGGSRRVGNFEHDVGVALRIIVPRPDAELLVVGHGLVEIVHNDADVMELVEHLYHGSFLSPLAGSLPREPPSEMEILYGAALV